MAPVMPVFIMPIFELFMFFLALALVLVRVLIRYNHMRSPRGPLKDAHVAGHEIVAVPDLLFYEVGNVLATKTRLSEAAFTEAFSLLWDFALDRFDLGLEEFQGGLALSRKYRITLYDAAYIELSKRLRCTFVTADKKLYEKVKNMKSVELL